MRAALIVLLVAMGMEAAPAAACTLYEPELPPRLLLGVDLRIMDGEDGLSLVTEELWVLDYLVAAAAAPAEPGPSPALGAREPGAAAWLAPLVASGAATMAGLGVLAMRRRRGAVAI
jgi:hypothetical protein